MHGSDRAASVAWMKVSHGQLALVNDDLGPGAIPCCVNRSKLRVAGASRLQVRRLNGGVVAVKASRCHRRSIISLVNRGGCGLVRSIQLGLLVLLGEAQGAGVVA